MWHRSVRAFAVALTLLVACQDGGEAAQGEGTDRADGGGTAIENDRMDAGASSGSGMDAAAGDSGRGQDRMPELDAGSRDGSAGDAAPGDADSSDDSACCGAGHDAGSDAGSDAGPWRDPRIGMSCEAAGVAADGGLGDECGSDQGACEKGRISCVDGVVVCVGEVTATQERCDCVDNDCDRAVDEDEGAGLCDGDQACAMCQCAAPCDGVPPSESCASGKAAVHVEHEGSERCLCVDSRCDADECSQQVIELGGEVVCAPAAQGVAACVCKENECSAVCAHVVCEGRWICDPLDGECKDPSCLAGFFPCAADQHCRLVDGGYACVSDPCADKACAGDEACRDGSCEKSCAKLACSPGNHCQGGYCVLDLCADSACGAGQVCNPADGGCVSEGACVNAGCPARQVCDPVAGDCIEDPCLALRCPVGERCESATGQCEAICFGSLLYCGGTCVNPQSSNDYCGASADCLDDRAGTACGSEQICSLGACAGSCAEGLVECEGGCIESQTDQLHCGASGDCQGGQAGQACEAPEVCIGGVCQGIL